MTDNVHTLIAEAKARGLQWVINELRSSASRWREYMKQDNVRLDSLQTWASMEVAADALEQSQNEHDKQVAAKAWDDCLDAIDQHELNTEQARAGNPFRASVE